MQVESYFLCKHEEPHETFVFDEEWGYLSDIISPILYKLSYRSIFRYYYVVDQT